MKKKKNVMTPLRSQERPHFNHIINILDDDIACIPVARHYLKCGDFFAELQESCKNSAIHSGNMTFFFFMYHLVGDK